MIAKCDHCANARKDCVSVGFRTRFHTLSSYVMTVVKQNQVWETRAQCNYDGRYTNDIPEARQFTQSITKLNYLWLDRSSRTTS